MSKNMILSCPPIGYNRINIIKENISEWLSKESLNKLVEIFGGSMPKNQSLKYLAKWLLEFSNCWDFRSKQKKAYDNKVGEGVRWLVTSNDLSDEQKQVVLFAAVELGLTNNSEPENYHYDYVWALGGARLSCLLRCRLAKSVIETKQSKCKAIVLLTSMRSVADSEREATDTYAREAKTEFDLFCASAKLEFCVDDGFIEERYDDPKNSNSSWAVRIYPLENYDIIIVAAPSSEPLNRRANSTDTYNFFAKKFLLKDNESILLTTSQIYVPYQHLEAIRSVAIPYNVNLDTIGYPTEWGTTLQSMIEPANYLQEIRSTIQSINHFLEQYN